MNREEIELASAIVASDCVLTIPTEQQQGREQRRIERSRFAELRLQAIAHQSRLRFFVLLKGIPVSTDRGCFEMQLQGSH